MSVLVSEMRVNKLCLQEASALRAAAEVAQAQLVEARKVSHINITPSMEGMPTKDSYTESLLDVCRKQVQ